MRGRSKFSTSLNAKKSKVNNHPAAAQAKALIRSNVADEMGVDLSVFDAFAGDGQMFNAVWHRAKHYVGCDLVWYRDEREAFVCDNKRVLRAIDLSQFNVFDFDAYGSPWEQVMILADRRQVASGERIGLLLTEGSGLNLKLGGTPIALGILAGVKRGFAGASRAQDDLINRAIAGTCKRMGLRVVKRWQATRKGGAAMRYIGLVLEGV